VFLIKINWKPVLVVLKGQVVAKSLKMIVRYLLPNDWNAGASIYKEGIATGLATFEKNVPSWETWDTSHMKSCRIIVENENKVMGWAALTPVSDRCVYNGVAEISVYVAKRQRGKGIGSKLLEELIKLSEAEGIWTLQAGIFPENVSSIELHKKMGFRIIGLREKIGKLDGVWKNNCILERRSKIVGVD
jgi:phosphinothricin acetyltransferase